MVRGFGIVAMYVKRFLERHGYNVHLGAWVDVKIGNRLVFDFQIGHWAHHRPPNRGVPSALYVVTEGPIDREARRWLVGYTYLFCPSRFVKEELEKIGLDCILMPHGIDTTLFHPLNTEKWIDVVSVGIVDSVYDTRKMVDQITRITKGYNTYVHMRPSLPYERLPQIYNMARVYLSVSGCEAFNIPVLEANACGLPAVYNDSCATGEVAYGVGVKPVSCSVVRIAGIPYYMCTPDVDGLRRQLDRLLSNPRLLAEMARRAREHALRYDYMQTYKPLLEVLPKP